MMEEELLIVFAVAFCIVIFIFVCVCAIVYSIWILTVSSAYSIQKHKKEIQ
jgi:hypothetical protein